MEEGGRIVRKEDGREAGPVVLASVVGLASVAALVSAPPRRMLRRSAGGARLARRSFQPHEGGGWGEKRRVRILWEPCSDILAAGNWAVLGSTPPRPPKGPWAPPTAQRPSQRARNGAKQEGGGDSEPTRNTPIMDGPKRDEPRRD